MRQRTKGLPVMAARILGFVQLQSTLVYIGHVGDSIPGGNAASAVACRPKPGGVLHALLGRAPAAGNFERSFQLLEPTGDNTFATAHVFREYTGWTGSHPCHAADTDCDGLDELVMDFHPVERVWSGTRPWGASRRNVTGMPLHTEPWVAGGVSIWIGMVQRSGAP